MSSILDRTVLLLVVAILVALIARRLCLPYTVGLVIAGFGLALARITTGFTLTQELIFDVILPPLLFEAALNIHWKELHRDTLLVLILATFGVAISAFFVAWGMQCFLSWPWPSALVFGVLIAATDPVAVIAMFKDTGVVGRLRLLVESESLLNDGVAAVFFAVVLAWALATVAAGLVMGNLGVLCKDMELNPLTERGRAFVLDFWEFAAFLANSLIFLLIGLRVATIPFAALGMTALLTAVVLVVVGRALAVYPLCLPFAHSRWAVPLRQQHVLWWGGLRGALALALVLSLPRSLMLRDELVIATFGVVGFSVIVQGLTMPPLLKKLGLLA